MTSWITVNFQIVHTLLILPLLFQILTKGKSQVKNFLEKKYFFYFSFQASENCFIIWWGKVLNTILIRDYFPFFISQICLNLLSVNTSGLPLSRFENKVLLNSLLAKYDKVREPPRMLRIRSHRLLRNRIMLKKCCGGQMPSTTYWF